MRQTIVDNAGNLKTLIFCTTVMILVPNSTQQRAFNMALEIVGI